MSLLDPPYEGNLLGGGSFAPPPPPDEAAPLEVAEWLESLNMAQSDTFTCTVERRNVDGTGSKLPALHNQALNTNEVGLRYGPGVYRVTCEWTRPEWKSKKPQRRTSSWFTIPNEFEGPHREWKREQEALRMKDAPVGSAGAMQVFQSGGTTKELVDLVQVLLPARNASSGDGGMAQVFAAVLQSQAQQTQQQAVLQAQQAQQAMQMQMQFMQMLTQQMAESQKMILTALGGRSGLDPNKEVKTFVETLQEKATEMDLMRKLGVGGSSEVAEPPSGMDKFLDILMSGLGAIAPPVIESLMKTPRMVRGPLVSTMIQSQPPAMQAAVHHLQANPTMQSQAFARLSAVYGPEQARKLMAVATDTKIDVAPAVVAQGEAEARAQAQASASGSSEGSTDVDPGA